LLVFLCGKNKGQIPIFLAACESSNRVEEIGVCPYFPMSVCQYLEPGKFKFDLIIFDEASQICVEDALPAILRGTQAVIAGDNKQLPPTSFFKAEEQYEFDIEENAPDIDNLESVLDECRGLGLKEYMLKWHYRSRHEDLINYSNYKFYGRQLITFPAPVVDVEYLGVKFDFVENAVYDRGGRRDNLAEANRVAELVFEHFKNYPEKSLGVATLSVAQMEAVWDAIEQKLKENSEYAKHFTDNRLEGFFVKNLENVQGDERDVIIFCVGYGKDAAGRLSMNFGPLNKTGGERRLNVLITRAREKNIVVASIKSSDFDPTITTEGVLHLRNYLAFAERGMDFLKTESTKGEDFDSPLEEGIANAIRQLGYEVVCQVGCAGYKIDLAIVDPFNPKKYILGVECDGATYHSSHTARDRDRLRQAVLENMGWSIHRIWSPDWTYKRSLEITKLKNAIETTRFEGRNNSQKKESTRTNESIKHDVIDNCQDMDSIDSLGQEYIVSDINRHYTQDDFYSSHSGQIIERQMIKIIEHEAPIHIDILFRRIMSCYSLGRMGDRIQGRLTEILRDIVRQDKSFRSKGGFVYTSDSIKARRPNPNHEESIREIEHIAPEEIQDAMKQIVHLHSGVTADCLFTETLKFFGFKRQTDAVVTMLKQNLKKLMNSGAIILKDSFLVVAQST